MGYFVKYRNRTRSLKSPMLSNNLWLHQLTLTKRNLNIVIILFDLAAVTILYACVPASFQPKLMYIARQFLDEICISMVFGKLWLKL